MNEINSILILGGGSAGFMTAATLLNEFPNKKITLIESPITPIIGVGESTIGGIKSWTKLLNINDKDFLKHTDGSYKLSIKFTDFYEKGKSFHYPFGEPYLKDNKALLNDWWFKKFIFPKTDNSNYADSHFPQMALVNQNKCFYNENNEIPFNFNKNTAYHFDAIKFANWLKNNFCLPKGLNYIKEDIVSIEQNENGIKSLNNKHTADLFIDCTGFKSLLLGETLKESFESYSDLLPNNSAWATRIPYADKEKELVPYTNCTAIENGWVWNIPLWNRIGTGYVYSDKFISDEDALIQFKEYLMKIEPYKLIPCDHLEFKNIKMKVGIHKRLWVKNVCAIGLAAGFIEPLESNGLFSVHEFLIKLVRNLQRKKVSQWDKDNFTFQCKLLFRNFAEFVALHYALSHRTDTKYWQENFNKNWEEKLINLKPTLINGLLTAGYNKNIEYHFPTIGGLHCIAAGMNWSPTDLVSLKYFSQKDFKTLKKEWIPFIKNMESRKKLWEFKVKDKPSLLEFLKENIYN
jgi:tryptophan halogenase